MRARRHGANKVPARREGEQHRPLAVALDAGSHRVLTAHSSRLGVIACSATPLVVSRSYQAAQDWEGALEAIELCRSAEHNFGLGVPFDIYLKRIQAFQESAPPADWRGIFVAETK